MASKMTERRWLSVFNPTAATSPEDTLMSLAQREKQEKAIEAKVAELIRKLPAKVCTAVIMHFELDGEIHDHKEIAKVTGIRTTSIPRVINEAIAQLRQAVV